MSDRGQLNDVAAYPRAVDLPEDWKTKRVDEVGSVKLGRQRSPQHQSGKFTTPYLRVANVFDGRIDESDVLEMDFTPREREAFSLMSGDILLNEGQSLELVGRSAIYEGEPNQYCFQNTLIRFRAYQPNDFRFCRMVFSQWLDVGRFMTVARQTTSVAHLGADRFASMSFPVPPPSVQQRIARILTTLDNLIEKTESLIAKYQAVKQGMMHDLFTRGVDAHGKLRPPQSDASDLYKQSELGWIPKEWEVSTLSAIANIGRGKFTPRPRNDPRFYGGSFPFIQTGDIANAIGRYLSQFSQTLNELGTTVSKGFPAGTIVVTIAANIADTAILAVPMYLTDSLVGVIVSSDHVVRFIELCLRRAKHRLDSRAPQSAQKNINLEDLRPLLIPLPSRDEQTRISQCYEASDAVIDAEKRLLDKLKTQKAGLLQDLLTGRVRVRVDDSEEATAHA